MMNLLNKLLFLDQELLLSSLSFPILEWVACEFFPVSRSSIRLSDSKLKCELLDFSNMMIIVLERREVRLKRFRKLVVLD